MQPQILVPALEPKSIPCLGAVFCFCCFYDDKGEIVPRLDRLFAENRIRHGRSCVDQP